MIGDTFKMKMESALERLRKFEVFRELSQKKLMGTYYYFQERHYIRG